MVDDATLLDALDAVRANVTPAVLARLEVDVQAARFYCERGSKTDAEMVRGLEALLELARELSK